MARIVFRARTEVDPRDDLDRDDRSDDPVDGGAERWPPPGPETYWLRCCHASLTPWAASPNARSHADPVTPAAATTTKAIATLHSTTRSSSVRRPRRSRSRSRRSRRVEGIKRFTGSSHHNASGDAPMNHDSPGDRRAHRHALSRPEAEILSLGVVTDLVSVSGSSNALELDKASTTRNPAARCDPERLPRRRTAGAACAAMRAAMLTVRPK